MHILFLAITNSEMQNYVQQDEDDGDDVGIQHLLLDIVHIQNPVSGERWWTGSHDDCLDDVFCCSSLDLIWSGLGD